MRLILPIIFHLVWLLPLAAGRVYGTIAALLLLALPYIKVRKLAEDLERAEAVQVERQGLHDARLAKEIAGLAKARQRWRALTFLPWWEARRGAGGSGPPPPGTR